MQLKTLRVGDPIAPLVKNIIVDGVECDEIIVYIDFEHKYYVSFLDFNDKILNKDRDHFKLTHFDKIEISWGH